MRNLGEAYHDATGQLHGMLEPGRFLFVYGVFYPDGSAEGWQFEAKHMVFLDGRSERTALKSKIGGSNKSNSSRISTWRLSLAAVRSITPATAPT